MAKALDRICVAVLGIFLMAFLCKGSVSAKEVVVRGQDIQAALNEAQYSQEMVTVTIPAGTYNLNSSLLVYSNTTIRAEGADITVNGGQAVLTHSRYITPTNIKISGGIWRSEADQAIAFDLPGSGILLENLTVYGSRNSVGILLKNVKDSQVNGCKIDGVAVGMKLLYCSNIQISSNTITNSAESGIFAEHIENMKVNGNTIKKCGKYGIWFDWEKSSVIKGNTLDGCAIDPARAGHGEGLVIQHGEGTWVEENKIYNVESHTPNYGNGVIISFSKSITVRGNTVVNSGNHGLQASYASTNVYFNDNTVNNSGKMGISVSRGSSADLTGNVINNSSGSGIVYDGKNWEQGSGKVSGTVKNCVINGSKSEGMHIELAEVTVQGTTIRNSTNYGVLVVDDSIAIFEDNVIRQDQVDPGAIGVVVNPGAGAGLFNNRICNFGQSGIVQNPGGAIIGEDNQIMVEADSFRANAVFLRDEQRAEGIRNNSLFLKALSGTQVTAQNYWTAFEGGAVVNGAVYTSASGNGGLFTVDYPQTDSGRVVVYVKDDGGNAVILQASPDFDLNKVQSGGQEVDVKKIEDFVKRMYRITLDREADADGLQYYVSRLQNGEIDGATVAQFFVGSPEFQNKKLSQEAYLKAMYSAFFDRVPADSEIAWWKNEMASGLSRKYVLSCFVNSPEFLGVCQSAGIIRGMMVLQEGEEYEVDLEKLGGFVDRLYEKALKRPSESDGRQYYIEQISTRKITAEQAAKNFFFSPEFESFKTSDQEYIERLYLTFMGRASESDGMYYWLNKMRGGMTREQVLSSFAASQEFKDILKSFGIRY
ncbi:MAG: DUF4214 domain-containing protein [Lachnospiraceae bacterium]|nr:DUF4214 domain-containing protein [Lachnospiraceae bacterium]